MFGKRDRIDPNSKPAKENKPEPKLTVVESPEPEVLTEPDSDFEAAVLHEDSPAEESDFANDFDDSAEEADADDDAFADFSESAESAEPAEPDVSREVVEPPPVTAKPAPVIPEPVARPKDGALEEAKIGIFNALIDSVDLTELSKLAPEDMRGGDRRHYR